MIMLSFAEGYRCAWVGIDEAVDAGGAGFERYGKTTRRAAFLAEMERVVPWFFRDGLSPASLPDRAI
jgi:hypothetical protein